MNARLPRYGTACLALAGMAASAPAQVGPYYVGGSVAYGHLSNALGQADEADLPSGYASRSDNVTSVALIGGVDQNIGRQRVFGDLTLRDNRYQRNKLLNHRNHAVTAGVDWQTIERISGNLTLRSSQDLVRFSTFERPTSSGRNLVKARQVDAGARIGVVTRYTLEGGAGHRKVDYSESSYDGRDYSQNSAFVGGRYWPGGSNYVGLNLRKVEGEYPRYVQPRTGLAGDRFDRQDIQLTVSLQGSADSSLLLRVARSDIDYQLQQASDFSGFTGLLRGSWRPTGKIQASAEIARDRGQDIAYEIPALRLRLESARLATAARLQLAYAASAKVEMHSNALFSRRTVVQGDTQLNTEERGRERATQWGLGVSWTPTRTSRVGCDLTSERRRADIGAGLLNVTSNSSTYFAQLTLQP